MIDIGVYLGKGANELRAQVLRVALSMVGPLVLKLREVTHYYHKEAHLFWGNL